MKRNIHLLGILLTASMLSSCLNDKSGELLDNTSNLPDVNIVISESAYSANLGDTICITPDITTDIAESDLKYTWEAKGSLTNKNNYATYSHLADGKDLNYICALDDNITNTNTAYSCRLHVTQVSTGRSFYSEPFTITITGLSGLMILHDDGNESDLGFLHAADFVIATASQPSVSSAEPFYYSQTHGCKMKGTGVQVIQSMPEYCDMSSKVDRCRVLVRTTEEQWWLNRGDLTTFGNWDSMFYLPSSETQRESKPRGYVVCGQLSAIFDGDDCYIMQQTSDVYPYLYPVYSPKVYLADSTTLALDPFMIYVHYSGAQEMLFAHEVNGETRKAFVTINDGSLVNFPKYTRLIEASEAAPFDPSNMHADLVTMATNSSRHVLSILKGDDTHPTLAGKYMLADIDPSQSQNDKKPCYLQDLSSLDNISDARFFTIGTTSSMFYYATSNGVQNFYAYDGELYPQGALKTEAGRNVTFTGEITMMKWLEDPKTWLETRYTDSNQVLMVATWDGSAAHLYTLPINPTSGRAEKVIEYNARSTKGWNFGRIRDIYIKGL